MCDCFLTLLVVACVARADDGCGGALVMAEEENGDVSLMLGGVIRAVGAREAFSIDGTIFFPLLVCVV